MVAQSESPLMDLDILKSMRNEMKKAGFACLQTIQFPLPTYPSGWWTATLARKAQTITSFREQMAKLKPFDTKYYNAGIHKACSALPQLLEEAL